MAWLGLPLRPPTAPATVPAPTLTCPLSPPPGCARRSSLAGCAPRPTAARGVPSGTKRLFEATGACRPLSQRLSGLFNHLSRRCRCPAQPSQRSAAPPPPTVPPTALAARNCSTQPDTRREGKGGGKPLPVPPAGAEEELNLRPPQPAPPAPPRPALPSTRRIRDSRRWRGLALQVNLLLRFLTLG